MTTWNEKQLTFRERFTFKQGLLHLRHIVGLSTALLAKVPFLRDPFGGEGVDVFLTTKRLANRYG